MNRPVKFGLLACLAVVTGLIAGEGVGQTPPNRRDMMRTKLEASKQILEGLTLEDYTLITRGAKALKTLSQAAEWEVPTIPNADEYVIYTGEFQRLADELTRKAKDRNIDGATLAYIKLTTSCVNCHKYVRSFAH
jgi:hypothetical protein